MNNYVYYKVPIIHFSLFIIHFMLKISNLKASIDGKEILHEIDLEVPQGEIHALMGPNGSGKSTLANVLMGHPDYEVTQGSVLFEGKNILDMEPFERARMGMFMAFQYPREISGVSLRSFLHAAYKNYKKEISPITFQALLQQKMDQLGIDHSFSDRSVNEGFSGGEKKKAEILQMITLEPKFALLDETDSGLDVDALKVVAEGVNSLRKIDEQQAIESQKSKVEGLVKSRKSKDLGPLTFDQTFDLRPSTFSCLIITHYARILDYIKPNRVHVMIGGRIVESGDRELAYSLEKRGYEQVKSE